MNTAGSRIQNRPRQYSGEDAAGALVNWLNLKEGAAAERITAVIDLFLQLETHAVPFNLYMKNGQLLEVQYEQTPLRDELEAKLKKLLSFYTLVPTIAVFRLRATSDETVRVIGWKAAPGSMFALRQGRGLEEAQQMLEDGLLPGMELDEVGALIHVLQLCQTGLIWKVSRCRCSKFFFRRFTHQRFCSTSCRISEFRGSDEARLKRNTYARELYRLRKTGKVK